MLTGKQFLFFASSLIAVTLLILFPMTRANAHKVLLYAYVEGNRIYAEAYFGDGKKAVNSLIEVLDKNGTKLLEGKTDKNGQFVFEVPKKDDLTLVLTASMGHRATFEIAADKITLPGMSAGTVTEAVKVEEAISQKLLPKNTVPAGSMITVEDVRAIIDESLDKKLKPIIDAMLESKREGPSVTEILGGIGYIFGIFGLILYFKSRRNSSS
jgi:nickel transport protein